MRELDTQIRKLVDAFAMNIASAAKTAAVEILTGQISITSSDSSDAGRGRALSRTGVAKRHRVAVAIVSPRPERELQSIKEKLLAYVAANPGARMEQLRDALGLTTAQLTPPMRALLTEKSVRVEGQTRARAYFVTVSRRSKNAS